MITRIAALVVVSISAVAVAHPPPQPTTRVDPEAEARIHTPPGFNEAGKATTFSGANPARLRITVRDNATGQPTFCRVNVVGSDGNYYEPADHLLAPYSLARLGNRQGKGPFRYYGWFFYCGGSFVVDVPAGATRIEVWKGYEYAPITRTVEATPGKTTDVPLTIARTAPMADLGYYSGDTHIHLPRQNSTDDDRALDLLEAEDMRFGYLLSANQSKEYSGRMDRQAYAQQRTLGPDSIARRGNYTIASGQEYVTSTYGHIGLLLHRRVILEGLTTDPSRWPLLGLIGQETRQLGGYSFNLHGGYANEIYIDFAQHATDAVELLQFAEYRGIALEGWYRMLNIGYQFPAVGACDYPFCRALGDCRTYVYSPQPLDAVEWARRAATGHSFFTTGPLLLLEVEGQRPGAVIRRTQGDASKLRARVRVRSLVATVDEVELIVDGRSAARLAIPAERPGDGWFELEHPLAVDKPCWIAARAWSKSPPGLPDAEAHTNPIWITVDDRLPYSELDLDWLVGRVDELMGGLEKRQFDERDAALEFYRASKAALLKVRQDAGRRISLDR